MIVAQAPGSLMLMGEHAVLQGYPALVCAIDQRMVVELIPRTDRQIKIFSPRLGEYHSDIEHLAIEAPFHFVLTTLFAHKDDFQSGFELRIKADFCAKMGLGSSAAVTVATQSAVNQWLEKNVSPQQLFEQCLQTIRIVQGLGSGADVAASVFGGTIYYQNNKIIKLPHNPPIIAIYSGNKIPTVTVVKQVQQQFSPYPAVLSALFAAMSACVESGRTAIEQQDWVTLGTLMNIHQGLMQALGVSDQKLNNLLNQLGQYPGIMGAKISGAGLGDCIVGIGQVQLPDSMEPLSICIHEQGCLCH